MDNGATAQYKYDHQNRRVSKIVGSAWTHYVWEGSQVIGEHDATTSYSTSYASNSARVVYVYAKRTMVWSRQRTSSTAAWTERYYLSDRWSTRLVLDTSGNVIGRQGHLAFGEEFAESGTQEKHHFTNYEMEPESGTDYAVNRQYSQSVGRFGSADPYQPSGYMVDPQSWNRYSYVENDPIHNVDPLGLFLSYPEPEADPCSGGPFSDTPIEPPKKKPTFCSIQLLTTGPRVGNYSFPDARTRIPDIRPDWNHGEHVDSYGMWTYFFEVQVTFSGGRVSSTHRRKGEGSEKRGGVRRGRRKGEGSGLTLLTFACLSLLSFATVSSLDIPPTA